MAQKTIYFYKLVLKKLDNNSELPFTQAKNILTDIINTNAINGAIRLYRELDEKVVMDIREINEEYLFIQLNKKRLNNSMQKRSYDDCSVTSVLHSDELENKGVEAFAYCIIGFSHGILSINKSNNAPDIKVLNKLFSIYNNDYCFQFISVPNPRLINELYQGSSPQINELLFEIPRANIQVMEQILGANEQHIIDSVLDNTESIVIKIKPQYKGSLSNDPTVIRSLIENIIRNKHKFKNVSISGKPQQVGVSKNYDLYEEYFKYPIDVKEYRIENYQKVEFDKIIVEQNYKSGMMQIYNDYKELILAAVDR